MATDTHQPSPNNRVTPGGDSEAMAPSSEPLAPASITLNAAPHNTTSTQQTGTTWQQYRWPIIGAAICIPLIILVVFILPRMVSSPIQATSPAKETTTVSGADISQPATQLESPWQDAQIAKARRETQDLLAKLLDKQARLENMKVIDWAQAQYQAALNLAQQGDESYRTRNFPDAQSFYNKTLTVFDSLLTQSDSVFSAALSEGQQAIQDGDTNTALAAYQRALAIQPNSEDAQSGLDNAKVLDKVVKLLKDADRAERQDKLNKAKDFYQQAATLIPQHQDTQERLTKLNDRIRDNRFAEKMAGGFAALAANNYTSAISNFEKALTIKPNSDEAKTALNQAKQQQTDQSIQSRLQIANQQESKEEWQLALNSYTDILALDNNIVEAQVGKIRSQARLTIDKRMTEILDNPARLNSPSVHSQYSAFYQDTLKIAKPGDKLISQLNQLNSALSAALQPVTVTLQSDNETLVTLYRVEELGAFTQTQVTLKPGSYTAVGTRRGYRDARKDFTVSADKPNMVINIQCDEKINNG